MNLEMSKNGLPTVESGSSSGRVSTCTEGDLPVEKCAHFVGRSAVRRLLEEEIVLNGIALTDQEWNA